MTGRPRAHLVVLAVLALAVGTLPALGFTAPAAGAPGDGPLLTRISGFHLDPDRARVRPDDYTAYRVDLSGLAGAYLGSASRASR